MAQLLLSVLSDREWILTNGLGGYALGFGNFINKRKYNGLLTASNSDLKRTHIISNLEERIESENNFFYLDSTHYSNCIFPSGYKHLVKTWLRPYPCAIFSSSPAHENFLIFKEIFLVQSKNAVAIKYTNLGKSDFTLIVRPKFTLRDHHAINFPGTWERTYAEKELTATSFMIRRNDNGCEAFGFIEKGELLSDHVIFRSAFYPTEAARGYDAVEDLLAPVRITIGLAPRESTFVVFSQEHLGDPMQDAKDAEKFYKSFALPKNHPTTSRLSSLIKISPENGPQFDMDDYKKNLELCCRDFIAGDNEVIAGFPWHGARGRDAMVALGGMKCIPDGKKVAVNVLKKYGRLIQNGLLPNVMSDSGIDYDSVDAPLWFVLRNYEYSPMDKELFECSTSIILNYLYNTNLPFFTSADGLIEIRKSDLALTWMDAKVYGTPVTPRNGKPIEIAALWYNALRAMRVMAPKLQVSTLAHGEYKLSMSDLDELIKKVSEALKKFIGNEYLADRLEDEQPIWEIRPNAVIALSLPFDFVNADVMKQVFITAKKKLLTPYGLRSLETGNPAFKQKYVGTQKQRDFAYHQGSVWSFLLAPLANLAWKIFKDSMQHADLAREISGYVWTLRDCFLKGEMASVAEVWDGIDPHFPKGCPAEAASVFALMEIECLLSGSNGGK